MFLETIFISLLFISLAGTGFILLRKIPALTKLPESSIPEESITSKIKKGVKKIPGAKKFDYELYLQKMLSKIQILTLRTEQKTGSWLASLRQRRNGHNHNDEYWEELKKAKDGK